MKAILVTDIHIYNEESLQQALFLIQQAFCNQKADLMICLGDFFDDESVSRQHAELFLSGCLAITDQWLFVIGNHDFINHAGSVSEGWLYLLNYYQGLMQKRTVGGRKLISIPDCADIDQALQTVPLDESGKTFVFCHKPLSRKNLDTLEKQGVAAVFHGHTHDTHYSKGSQNKIEQFSVSCFRFGGRLNESGMYGLLAFDDDFYELKVVHQHVETGEVIKILDYPKERCESFPHDPDLWQFCPPLIKGDQRWEGGFSFIRYFEKNELRYETSLGECSANSFPLLLISYGGKEYLLVSATWGVISEKKGYRALAMLDPLTGKILRDYECIGLTARPVQDGRFLFVHDQWQKVFCIDLENLEMVWDQTSRVSALGKIWRDNRPGGGWSICELAVGRHVWAINPRGDIIGYDKKSGVRKWVYPMAVKLKGGVVPYGPYEGFSFDKPIKKTVGDRIFYLFGEVMVDDISGNIQQI